jgi:hypothetical protein
MSQCGFDATITLNDHHLEAAGLSGCKAQAIAAVREAVGRMEGAGSIDVEAESYPPGAAGWVIVYPRGRCVTPDTTGWRELRHRVENGGDRRAGSGRRAGLTACIDGARGWVTWTLAAMLAGGERCGRSEERAGSPVDAGGELTHLIHRTRWPTYHYE